MKQTNTKLLGMFVVGGIALLAMGIVVFGSGRFFQKTLARVAYFQESLAGLADGAPVNFRGVRIGTVTRIVFEYDRSDLTFATPVYFELDPSRFVETGKDSNSREERSVALIKKGLRAQLGSASLVTGQRVLNLVMRPGTKATLVGEEPPGVEIPTIPSNVAELKTTLTHVLNRLAKLNIERIGEDIHGALSGFTKLVDNPEIAEIIHNANLTVPDVRKLVEDIDRKVDPLADSFGAAADKVAGTFETANDTLGKADGAIAEVRKTFVGAQGTLRRGDKILDDADELIKPGSQPYYELVTMMREITATARSIRSLANTLERDPGSLLFGKQRSPRR
jgi:paraquat-inducible protein B